MSTSGRVCVQQIDPAEMSPGEFAHMVRQSVQQNGVQVVIIDSLNGYMNAMPEERFLVLQMHELLSTLNQLGVITILVLAQHGLMGPMQTPLDISYLSDAVLMLRYFEAEGRVRRAISVVKKRSGAHEDTIREFRLTNEWGQSRPAAYRVSGHPDRRAGLPGRCEPAASDRKTAGLTGNAGNPENGERVLVLAPTGRDGRAACAIIEQAGLAAKLCSGIDTLRTALEAGAGAAVIAEEAFFGVDLTGLFDWVETQPPWSDFPFVILTTRRDDPRPRQQTLKLIANLRNVMLQERPLQAVTLVSTVQAALRARLRQYQTARHLAEREHAASRLEQLVGERTRQLQDANNRLIAAQESLTMALEAAQMRTWHLDLADHRAEHREGLAGAGPVLRGRVAAGEMERSRRRGVAARRPAGVRGGFRPGARLGQVQSRSPRFAGGRRDPLDCCRRPALSGSSRAILSGWPARSGT